MRILAQSLLIASLLTVAIGFKTNRTSCFHYVSCLEATEANLKQCAGGTAISLTLEAKDVNIRDLVKYRALEFVGCQDRLLKEIVDFEALQILVNEDARECFEKLPESSKRVEQFTDSCDYVQPVSRNSSKGDALQCLIEFKQDREYCESLLECCPDHTRCGERMNAVSLSYQNARVKAEQIVYSMISCIVVNDPRFLREGARLQSLRDPYRNAGVPFLRPDAYTEARITRRLALTSTSTLSQRRERFLKKYSQIRQVVTQNLFGQQQSKLNQPVEDLVTETSSKLVETPEDVTTTTAPEEVTTPAEMSTTPEETKESETTVVAAEVTEAPEAPEAVKESSEMHVNTIRNLIRSASDKDLSKYVSLISEGKFSELFELAEKKKVNLATKFDEKLSAKMSKLKDLINEALSEKDKSSEIEKSFEKVEKAEKPELVAMEDKDSAAVFTISDELEQKTTLTEAKLAHTIVSRNVAEAENAVAADKEEKESEEPKVESKKESEKLAKLEKTEDVKAIADEKKPGKLPLKIEKLEKPIDTKSENQELTKVLDDKERALLVESEIKNTADETKHILETLKSEESAVVGEDLPALEKEESGEAKKEEATTTTTAPESTTVVAEAVVAETDKPEAKPESKPELVANTDDVLTVTKPDTEVEGSGEGEEDVTTTAPSLLQSSKVSPDGVIENVKRIRPRTEQTHCQQYASCWQTVLDYEQQCDRKYSTEVLSHGIDDSEILNILHNSSISHHEIVLKACLRPLDRSVHSTLKQLLVIQRGVRKACLELGRNKIAVTDAEEELCNTEVPTTAAIDEFISSEHVRSQSNHLTCRAKLEPIREACGIVRNCCASVETCDNYISSSPVKKLETEAIRRLVKKQNDCETKMLQTLSYIHEQLSNPTRRRRFYYH
ncbi:Protein CBG20775 [Caenorhabditis briggsae]|uniref:Protein CBG20775 n=1 Tax=Caenorhabditis briggsae TaxID=6238 RepID=A8XYL0_CAEBR|nr:Protein CBG20775 [Caenorhabditis briggsae]CAP37727.1 Protein CBG20775 [Caenorhabditis briggsae]